MNAGQRVTISRYHGAATGVISSVTPGHITVDTGKRTEVIDLSRRTVKVIG